MSTDLLFAKPTFMRGMASLGNLDGAILVNVSSTPEEADTQAIALDWSITGMDVKKGLDSYAESI